MNYQLLWFVPALLIYLFIWYKVIESAIKDSDTDALNSWIFLNIVIVSTTCTLIGILSIFKIIKF
jgi:hypothetical protein